MQLEKDFVTKMLILLVTTKEIFTLLLSWNTYFTKV